MVNAFGQGHQITRLDVDTNPAIVHVTNVKVSASTQNVADFFGIMNVLFKKRFNLLFKVGQMIGVDGDNVGVVVTCGEGTMTVCQSCGDEDGCTSIMHASTHLDRLAKPLTEGPWHPWDPKEPP